MRRYRKCDNHAMRKKALRSYLMLFLLLILLNVTHFFEDQLASAQTSNPGEVKGDALFVYSEMSATSIVVKTLKQGDRVSIRLQVTTAEGDWCKIAEDGQRNSLGYVPCAQLLRASKPHAAMPPSQASTIPVISSSAGAQASGASRTGSFVTSFPRETLKSTQRDPNIAYDL